MAAPAHRPVDGVLVEDAHPARAHQHCCRGRRGAHLAPERARQLDLLGLRPDQHRDDVRAAPVLLHDADEELLPPASPRHVDPRRVGALATGAHLHAGRERVVDDTAVVVAFYVLSVITLVSALMVAVVRDLIHAVLFLILAFIGMAGLYITLSADFVAVVQVLIYAGAISVLMIFAVLLTPRSDRDNAPVSYAAPLSVLAGLLGAVIIFVGLDTNWRQVEGDRDRK